MEVVVMKLNSGGSKVESPAIQRLNDMLRQFIEIMALPAVEME